MQGYSGNEGVIPLSIRDIFNQLTTDTLLSYDVKVSYIEIYNEAINDLLDPSKKNLEIRENGNKEIFVNNLTEIKVRDYGSVLSLLKKGEDNRMVAETKLNENSSRSHSVFRLNIDITTKKKKMFTSQLNLIDLAGSENASKTNCVGIRFKEGTNINKSLLALSNVINKLSQNQKQFVSFRDSKLTRLLQSSLGGNSKTAIICTITDDLSHYSETLNTMLFGLKAKNIKTIVKVNEVQSVNGPNQGKIVGENEQLKTKIKELENWISAQKTKDGETIQITEQITNNRNTKAITSLEKEITLLKTFLQKKHEQEQEINEINNNIDNEACSIHSGNICRNLMYSNVKPNFKRMMTTAKKPSKMNDYYTESAIKPYGNNYDTMLPISFNNQIVGYPNDRPIQQQDIICNPESSEYDISLISKLQNENEALKMSIFQMKSNFFDLLQNKENCIQALNKSNELTIENCDKLLKEAESNYLILKEAYESLQKETEINDNKNNNQVNKEYYNDEQDDTFKQMQYDYAELYQEYVSLQEENQLNTKKLKEVTELNNTLTKENTTLINQCRELSSDLKIKKSQYDILLQINEEHNVKMKPKTIIDQHDPTNENSNPNITINSLFNNNNKLLMGSTKSHLIKNDFLSKKRLPSYTLPSNPKLAKTAIKKIF